MRSVLFTIDRVDALAAFLVALAANGGGYTVTTTADGWTVEVTGY